MKEFHRRLLLLGAAMLVVGFFLAAFGLNSFVAARQETHRVATAAAATGQAVVTMQAAATQAAAAEARALASSIGAVADRSAAEQARDEALRQVRLARSDALALESAGLSREQPDLARLLAVAAFRLADTFRARDSLLRAWQATFSPSLRLSGGQAYLGMALSPDGNLLVAGREDGGVDLWNPIRQERLEPALEGRSTPLASLAFSPDGKLLAAGYADDHLVVFDLRSRSVITDQIIEPITASLVSLDFSPGGHLMASTSQMAGGDEKVWLWDTATWKPVKALPGAASQSNALAFHPAGKFLVTGSPDGGILSWDLSPLARSTISPTLPLTGTLSVARLAGTDDVQALAFTPDGAVLASGHADGSIVQWNWATSQRLGDPWPGLGSPVTSLAYSPDRRYLAAGQEDGSLVIREASSGKPLGKPFTGQEVPISGLAFSPDGKWLASSGQHGPIRLWPLDPQGWATDLCQRTGRNLTRAEWEDYLPGFEYSEVCCDRESCR